MNHEPKSCTSATPGIRTRWSSPYEPAWMPPTEVVGPEQFPVMKRVILNKPPSEMVSFSRFRKGASTAATVVHGYVDDTKLQRLIHTPASYLDLFSSFEATVTPDLSIRTGMPPHQRIMSAWMGRAIGAYFSYHGLKVVPNVRWAVLNDLDVVLDGIPTRSTIAISTQSLTTTPQLFQTLIDGIPIVTNAIDPATVLVYGPMPSLLRDVFPDGVEILNFSTDLRRVHTQELF